MKSVPVTVGLDYSAEAVRVCVLDAQGRQLLNRDVENSSAGGHNDERSEKGHGWLANA